VPALTVTIDDPKLSDRYMAVVLSGARENTKSPLLIQTYLARIGLRPINAVVDVTNYLMMLTGQPLHAFDYDKLVAIGGGRERTQTGPAPVALLVATDRARMHRVQHVMPGETGQPRSWK